MNNKNLAALCIEWLDKSKKEGVVVLIVDTNAMLNGDGHRDRLAHGLNAIGNKHGLAHQAGTKGAFLHAIAWAAAVQVNLVIAQGLADGSSLC